MLGIQCSRKAIYDWINEVDLQPVDSASPNHAALDEIVIRIGDQQFWFDAVNPETNEILRLRLFPTTIIVLTEFDGTVQIRADLQPAAGQWPDHVAVDETVIWLNHERYWIFAAVDP